MFQINKIIGKRSINSDTTEIKRVRDYYEQLHANQLDNLQEIDNIPKNLQLIQAESWNNRKFEQINTEKEIESVIRNLPINKTMGQVASLMNSMKCLKKN